MKNLKKYGIWAVWVSVVVLLIFSWTRVTEIDESLFGQFESFDNHELIETKPLVYRVSKAGEEIGYLAFGEAYGYQSDIQTGVVISDEGQVMEVAICHQNETPSFIGKIYNNGFLESQFPGKAILDGFDTSSNIQAVSGATISSNAITKAVTEASQVVGKNYLSLTVPSNTEIKFGTTEIVLIGMLFLAVLSYKLKNKKLRYLTMAYSLILLGFKYKQFIAYSWLVSLVLGKVPSLASNVGWFILIGGTLLFIAVTGKNAYCNYICPFGALQEAENRLAKFDFFKVSPQIRRRLKIIPAILAYSGFVLVCITQQMGVVSFEPYSLVFGRMGNGIQWALLPIVLIMSLFVMRFYCNFFCPVGFVLKLSVKLRRKIASMIHGDQRTLQVKAKYEEAS